MEFNKLQHVPSVTEIKQVAEQLKGVISETPLEFSASLSARYGANIYLKREDLQVVRSYKIRGAYHKITNIPSELRSKGVVAASAGNHAQGVALACALLGIQAHIFMPKSTPLQKVEAVRFFGKEKVRIYLVGETYDEAFAASRKFCESNGAIYIPPFDDFDIIAGQATVTLEILDALPVAPDFLFLAIGGGGLAAGASLVLPSSTKLIGVEPAGAPSMQQSLAASEVVVLDEIDRFVDGASVKQVGLKTFAICAKGLARMLTVSKKALCQTMLDLYALRSMIVEPAGALSVAGLEEMAEEIKGKTVVCVISGGNFDPKRFPEIKSLASA
ncbi:threonine ammonia-lyase IlvA [Aquirufa lenticrescens]|uniref:threonine ammonia-lyase IlvA n=1 Tax=Aquirufa lenticrescens TaxID=2696560 RepID=UPI001CAA593E|nr:threonine ammonia-lyase IlvA [Aquirufa lenticrescens]UAJ14465.1 threonine ammonia-lyase IlvA [Aquirufa lenticrescens]